MEQAQDVTVVLIDEFPPLALSCALAPLALANQLSGRTLFAWHLTSVTGREVTSANGYSFLVDRSFQPTDANGLLLVLSGARVERVATSQHVNYLRREKRRGTRIGALCSGAYVLARAGMLEGVRTAVSSDLHDTFDAFFPDVPVTSAGFVADERYYSASHAKAALDLMLAHVESRHGKGLAGRIADQIVEFGVRSVATEVSSFLKVSGAQKNAHLAEAIRLMAAAYGASAPSAAEIAGSLGISPRQLQRLFRENLNRTPKGYLTHLRLSKAREMLLQHNMPISQIADACGFGSSANFSRVYRREFGVSPASHRKPAD
ncbi:GlxA family transcriptional regulator [Frigidibacter sp. ROC022]|uniref:GlxA family transcriptional regulator n=1 Tax=Frigidibacter sp. ROC022 TaxID=2971796 RepID=UPI00215A52CC|nr:helix-turn-helix domain-containing protein [Frigidibacter sp. ROC022]MCR8726651.1 helix-turn-helix domain-containing protein [Frigidibacter sp. ROC022]